jgi:hypothetical protein
LEITGQIRIAIQSLSASGKLSRVLEIFSYTISSDKKQTAVRVEPINSTKLKPLGLPDRVF